jgi:virulence-associated protein VapD
MHFQKRTLLPLVVLFCLTLVTFITAQPNHSEQAKTQQTASVTPIATQMPVKLLADDGTARNVFGWSVTISADGTTALVGTEDGFQAAVYVFVRNGEVWEQQAKLLPDYSSGYSGFGWQMSLSADGNTAFVGDFLDDVGMNKNQGSVYIYMRSDGVWMRQAKLLADDGSGDDRFGGSVSVSADGNTLVVGASGNNVGANESQGSVYVYVRSDGVWKEQAKLLADDGETNDQFGGSVSISADGNIALIAADGDAIGVNDKQGSVYVYMRSDGVWKQQAKLVADDGEVWDVFGGSVSISADGNIALIAASGVDIGVNENQGSVYVYVRSDGVWKQQAKLLADDGEGWDAFGGSVSISADGNTALIGARGDDVGDNVDQGSAYVFVYSGGIWIQQTKLLTKDGAAKDTFGLSVSISGDGNIAMSGAVLDDVGRNTDQGSVRVFSLP